MIKQRNISLISSQSNKNGGRRVPEAVIERDYCLSWFLFGLASLPLKNNLIFKGGTALRRCYFKDYRYSEDLDFTLIDQMPLEEILTEFNKIYEWVKEESGIIFTTGRVEPSSQNTHTFYIQYVGPLPGSPKEVKVDVTFKEILLTITEEKGIIKSFDQYEDFLSEPKIRVYSLDEVIIEKTCALFSPARNEPRDLFDITYLLKEQRINLDFLLQNVNEKLKNKGINFDSVRQEFEKKEKRLEKLWRKRLEQQMNILPEFEETFRDVKRAFRQAGLFDDYFNASAKK